MPRKRVSKKRKPNFEDYATVETMCNGAPVYSFDNIMFVHGQGPDLLPGLVMQEGNPNPIIKFTLKKSWEIKHNLLGFEHEMSPSSPWNDTQPMLPIHLIDGDRDTAWSSWGCPVQDGWPEWIRIDLPVEAEVSSVALLCSVKTSFNNYGRSLPNQIEVCLSRDAWHWETVYENKDFLADGEGDKTIEFTPRLAKAIWIKANDLTKFEGWGYVFSIGEVEVRDLQGNNLALVSRGAGVTVSSTMYAPTHCSCDHRVQNALWCPTLFDLGSKWVRTGPDNGSLTWSFIEHEKGKLEVDPEADRILTEVAANGVNIILVLDFKANWIYMDPPSRTNWKEARFRELNGNYQEVPGQGPGIVYDNVEMFAAYLRWVDYMARHFKGRVAYYEVGNEWNGISPKDYMQKLFEPTYHAIKQADPDAKVMLGSPAGFAKHFMANEQILDCLGKEWKSGIEDGKLVIYPEAMIVREGLQKNNLAVTVSALDNGVGQYGILLRYRDQDNYLAAIHSCFEKRIFLRKRINGEWGVELAPQSAEGLGEKVQLSVKDEGAQITVTLSDGTKNISIQHLVKVDGQTDVIGLIVLGGGAIDNWVAYMPPRIFEGLQVTDSNGGVILQENFSGPAGELPMRWKYVSGPGENPIKRGWGKKVDAIGWHPSERPDKEYAETVRAYKKELAALGFTGPCFANEIYTSAGYPPGPPQSGTEMAMGKYFARSIVLHSVLDMEAGPCHPFFLGGPHPQSCTRWTWPTQTVVPGQPSVTYYMYRNLATALDDLHPAEFPVTIESDRNLITCTFESGDGAKIMSAWIDEFGPSGDKELTADSWRNVPCGDGIVETKVDIIIPGLRAKKAKVVDTMNGTEQQLVITTQDGNTVLKGMLIKDYPTFIVLK